MQNYSALHETQEADEEGGVVLVHVAEPSRTRWTHIDDLDSFFTRIYQYHQRHGFFCMFLRDFLDLTQFVFVVFLTLYVYHGINYPVLFKDKPPPNNATKVTLSDVVLPFGDCVANFTFLTWFAILIAFAVWSVKVVRFVLQTFNFWDIKQFFNTALKIEDPHLGNLTWHDVQSRVRTVQIEQQMCIHKRELTELDIYHRILRQDNYLVAMVNKRLLPARLEIPMFGEYVYWTAGFKFNIKLLLFWSPWSLFEHSWQLREEYKKPGSKHELSKRLGRQILWFAFGNLVFAPIIFVWEILNAFFNYAALIRKEPAMMAIRRWSLYSFLYLRHFNELPHELNARLTRAHRASTKYLSAFSSPVGSIVSEYLGFNATAFLAIFVTWTIIDEDVLAVEHVLTIMTILTVLVAVLRTVSPDETTSLDLEDLLTKVVIHTHYLPSDWVGQAHTTRVRKEFEQLFQYGFVSLLETVMSPILTPFILYFYVHPRAPELVNFFHNFTVNVVGVGDVCSFAQMDVRKHGNPEWHEGNISQADQMAQCEDGKVELSLIHFKCTNPSWKPPESVQAFVKNVQNQSSMIGSMSNRDPLLNRLDDDSSLFGAWRIGEPCHAQASPTVDIPLYTSGIWRSRNVAATEQPHYGHMSRMWTNEGVSPSSIREMAINATYLHSLHSNKTENRARNTAQETTPLLSNH